MTLTEHEKRFIKQNKALPKSAIIRMIEELKDVLIATEDTKQMKIQQEFIKELRHWLITIEIFSQEQKKEKKETFV